MEPHRGRRGLVADPPAWDLGGPGESDEESALYYRCAFAPVILTLCLPQNPGPHFPPVTQPRDTTHADPPAKINTPFILAPPLAAKAFYASISGSYRLPPPYSNFYAYPCNNPPYLHFEFGGWRFPIMRGTKSKADHRGANGKFSLGKVSDDSGYCVGAVVETRMGVGDASPVRRGGGNERFNVGFESGMLAGNGLRDVWVLGEPVFRGMGVVFDVSSSSLSLLPLLLCHGVGGEGVYGCEDGVLTCSV